MTSTPIGRPSNSSPSTRRLTRRLSRRPRPMPAAGRLLVWLFVLFNLFALAWVLLTSLRPHVEIFADPFGIGIPPAFANYAEAWLSADFGRAFLNTVLLAGAGSLTVATLSAPAAFVLGRNSTRTSGSVFLLFAVGIGVPVQVMIIPLFTLLQEMQLLNSLFGLYLATVAAHLPFTVLLLTGFFRTLPGELEEAAALDGCSPLRSFLQIMLPLARGGLITVLLLNAIFIWNETFLALVLIQSSEKQVLSVALLDFIATQQFSGADYGALFAGVTVLVLPMVALYVWLGRRIIEGLTIGSGK